MNVVVFGAGSLGSLVGGLLARAHDVTLVGRDPHVAAVSEGGLSISGEFEFTVEPLAATTVSERADLAVVTVKAYDTDEAAAALAAADPDSCLSLQNGMGNEATLADRLDCPVLAGTCTYGARLAEPGHVECTGLGEVAVGPRGGGTSAVADAVGTTFDEAGFDVTVVQDMPRCLWEKLAVNAGINATTALARVENGALVDGPGSEVAAAAARETARAARSTGVNLADDRAATLVNGVASDTAANHSSMLQDVESGSRTEVDAINGYVAEVGRAAGFPVPVNETLAGLARGWEAGRDLRN